MDLYHIDVWAHNLMRSFYETTLPHVVTVLMPVNNVLGLDNRLSKDKRSMTANQWSLLFSKPLKMCEV